MIRKAIIFTLLSASLETLFNINVVNNSEVSNFGIFTGNVLAQHQTFVIVKKKTNLL